jgi:hypothetical protein
MVSMPVSHRLAQPVQVLGSGVDGVEAAQRQVLAGEEAELSRNPDLLRRQNQTGNGFQILIV